MIACLKKSNRKSHNFLIALMTFCLLSLLSPENKAQLKGKRVAQSEAELNELGSSGIEKNKLLLKDNESQDNGGRSPSSVTKPNSNLRPSSSQGLIGSQSQLTNNGSNVQLGLRDGGVASNGVIIKIYQGQMQSESSSLAKKKITDEALLKTAESLILDLVGPELFQKNKVAYSEKIIKNASRFIPVIKTNDIVKDNNGFYNLTVTLNANLKVLESMLKENNLFYVNETMPQILPLVSYTDLSSGQSFKWWKPNAKDPELRYYENQYLVIEKGFVDNFTELGFKVNRPDNYGQNQLPQELSSKDEFLNEDLTRLSLLFKSPVIVTGEVKKTLNGRTHQIEVVLTAKQAVSGRILAELVRRSSWENVIGEVWSHKKINVWISGVMKDLGSQIKEAWQRGTLNTTTIKLIVKGGISPVYGQKFKDTILAQSKFVRQIRERLISFEETIYEIEISGTANDVSLPLQTVSVPGLGVFKLTTATQEFLELTKM